MIYYLQGGEVGTGEELLENNDSKPISSTDFNW